MPPRLLARSERNQYLFRPESANRHRCGPSYTRWMNLQDTASWISIAKDVVPTTAVVVAAGVAVKGLHAWKRQLHGNANYELSRRLLRGAYKVREAIRSVRAPFMSLGEMNAAIRAAGLEGSVQNPDSETNFDKAESVAYQARWDKVVQAQLEFAADVLEAEVVWGPMIREKAEPLAKCTAKLNVALAQWV